MNASELNRQLYPSELVAAAKERFSKSGANEFCTMLYGKAVEHHFLDEETFKQIEGVIPSIIARDKPQNQFDVNTAQINVNPQSVNNYTKEKEKD